MKRILEIDLENGRICVEPGSPTQPCRRRSACVLLSTDPSSQIVCSIGGNVAENAGGAHCFKYGFTTTYVTGLELVLADGEMILLGGYELDAPGYDLMGVFVARKAHSAWRRRSGFASYRSRGGQDARGFLRHDAPGRRGGAEIVQGGVVPGALEIMDAKAIEAAEQSSAAGFPVGRGAVLLVELDGSERECEAHFAEIAGSVGGAGPMT